ncbi:MAG: tRNA uridine-5-carboxymethylaminomethyl(34) synthesis GTPase MnmE, partial [Candidatus Thiodiazotropha taylori]|nr:tRNA uridine-5-carboxymethylaminomethyl(34) synthesis GTPase MnmE [Candidatus Thiodiazotropha taylori]MCW4232137.1 tRNA uridine-5-carboxymethylaminomethyl(34) synthesis GTPase MnmE [Candidatus Thiodiazotropha taylori]
AGLRESDDPIEAEGVRRAREQMAEADRVLWVFDDRSEADPMALERTSLPEGVPVTLIRNKIDLTGKSPGLHQLEDGVEICLSAKQGEGMSLLNDHLKQCAGYHDQHEGEFIARRRHLDALQRGMQYLEHGQQSLLRDQAGELLAEDLRVAQLALSEITGEFTADDLLGRIFSSFCIGK